MKRVYVVDHPVGYGRSSRKVIEQKTARVRYQDAQNFKRQCMALLASETRYAPLVLEAEKGDDNAVSI